MDIVNCFLDNWIEVKTELRDAKYAIWIVTEQVPDHAIYKQLTEKVLSELNVEIVLIGDHPYFDDNDRDFKQFINAGGEFYHFRQRFRELLMLTGFFIIDHKTVIRKISGDKTLVRKHFGNYSIIRNASGIVRQFTNGYLSIKNKYSVNLDTARSYKHSYVG
jgi:hypothetical protein